MSICLVAMLTIALHSAQAQDKTFVPAIPTTYKQLWANYDPQAEPMESKILKQWEEEAPYDSNKKIIIRKVIFTVGTFKGKKSRVAGFFAFPKGAKTVSLSGLLHLHGGGQRAFLHEVRYYAGRGYACLSINWGGRPMEDQKKGTEKPELNTDWGAVNPTQTNVPGYFNFAPGEKYLDAEASPRNNNWYLLTLAARRGIRFLYDQTIVHPARIGVYGLSMGGNLTIYTAGTEPRIKVAVAEVGGSGFRTFPRKDLPAYKPRNYGANTELYRKTLAFQAYTPHIKASLLYLGATNDFHGIMDDTYKTGDLVPDQSKLRYSFTPHMNHRFTPEFAITEAMWLDQHLRGDIKRPKMAGHANVKWYFGRGTSLRLSVTPDQAERVDRIQIFYTVDPDPRSRFWRTAQNKDLGDGTAAIGFAELPLMTNHRRVSAFANIYYKLDKPIRGKRGQMVDHYAISSPLLHWKPTDEERKMVVTISGTANLTIDDFKKGWRDWYILNKGNPHHWQYWTRKVTDPMWRGPPGAALELQIKSQEKNKLVIIVKENVWRNYRGKRREFAAVVQLQGSDDFQTIKISPSDFKEVGPTPKGEPKRPPKWDQLDELGLAGRYEARRAGGGAGGTDRVLLGGQWKGPKPQFQMLRWQVLKGPAKPK